MRAPPRGRAGAGLRHGVPDRGDPGRGPERPWLEGRAGRQPRGGHRPAPGERHPARPVLQGSPPGDPGPAGGPPARRRPVRVGDAGRRARRRPRPRRSPGAARFQRRGPAVLRHQPPRSLGLAGQPVHLDQGPGGGRPAGPADPDPDRASVLGQPAGQVGGPGDSVGVPRGYRGAADLGPAPPLAVLPDLHPASLAQLAGTRVVHHRRLRRRRRGVPDRLPGRIGGPAAGRRGFRHPAGPGYGVLHRVPVRPGQGQGPVAEPAAGPAPGRAGRAGRRRRDLAVRALARPSLRRDRDGGAARRGRGRARAARRRGDHRSPIPPSTRTWPPPR